MLLKEKVVLVTGSTTGIGEAIARECVRQGARVMIHGRNQERARSLVDEVGKDSMGYVLADLTEKHIGEKLIQATLDRFTRIDCLVNNAGLSPRVTLEEVNDDNFDWIMRLNVRAPLLLTQAAVKQFRQQQSNGAIVNIGSINAYCGETSMVTYPMTKGALMTMTRNLGDALSIHGIRVNQLNVGWTLTDNEIKLKQGQGYPEDWEKYVPEILAPNGRIMRPEDVARHTVFWLSEQSAPVTGQVYEVEQYPVIGRNYINKIPLLNSANDM